MAQDEKRSERRMYLIVSIIVLALVGLTFYWEYLNATPQLSIPTPVMPSPNAYDIYIDAAHKIVYPPWRSPEQVIRYIARADIQPEQPMMYPGGATRPAPTLAELKAFVKSNMSALTRLRQGFAAEYREPSVRVMNNTYPDYALFFYLIDLLLVDAINRHNSGDFTGAISSCIDAMELGNDIKYGGGRTSMNIGCNLQNYTRHLIWKNIPHLTARHARILSCRFNEIIVRKVAYADILQEVKWDYESGIVKIMRQPDWRDQLAGTSWRERPTICFVSKNTVLLNYDRFMNGAIAIHRRPYISTTSMPILSSDPINTISRLKDYYQGLRIRRLKYEFSNAQNAWLLIALALQAYRVEHGAYPNTLNKLVPDYLPVLPADHFALKGSMRYRQKGDTYVLYSIGPDGKDDGGVPSIDGRKRPRVKSVPLMPLKPTYSDYLTINSTGDIVAGVNIK